MPALDGFRAYAILGVVVLHALFFSGAIASTSGEPLGIAIWGLLGNVIDVFFIVSGFVLFLPIAARGGEIRSLRDYAIARAARLLPAYWTVLAVMLALIAIFPFGPAVEMLPGAPAVDLPSVGNLLAHLTAVQMPARMLDAEFLVGFGLNGPLWMISVIVSFYLVLPLVARSYFRHPLIGLLIALVVTVLWKEAAIHDGEALASLEGGGGPAVFASLIAIDQFPGWAFSFACGMTGAWAYLRHDRSGVSERGRRAAMLVMGAAVVVFVLTALDYGRQASELSSAASGSVARLDTWLNIAYTASRAVLIGAVVVGPIWLQRLFANRPARWLAERSYSLYLIHFPVAAYIGVLLLELPREGTFLDSCLWLGVVITGSLVYATISIRLIERPAARWSRRMRARERPGVPVGQPVGPAA